MDRDMMEISLFTFISTGLRKPPRKRSHRSEKSDSKPLAKPPKAGWTQFLEHNRP